LPRPARSGKDEGRKAPAGFFVGFLAAMQSLEWELPTEVRFVQAS
jgi:hypothetical protein